MIGSEQVKEYLDSLLEKYNCESFIADDPISVPHRFSDERDIEISGFLAATIAWGQRRTIVRNAHAIVERMDGVPYEFVMGASESDLRSLDGFVHRTFNDVDLRFFVRKLGEIYRGGGGLGYFFQTQYAVSGDLRVVLGDFYEMFFSPISEGIFVDLPSGLSTDLCAEGRTTRHLSNIRRGAACKRLLMYLKWMVRRDAAGVDFGLWDRIPASALYLPLDVHCGNVSRELGLLSRTQNDWRAVEEVTASLREFDPIDPVKYDFALFSAGIHKEL